MIRLFRQYISPRKTVFIIGEGILIFLAVSLASFFILGRETGLVSMLRIIWPKVLLISLITQLSLYFNDLYQTKTSDSNIDLASRLIQSIGITSITLAIIYFLWPDMIIGRWIFFVSLIFLLLFLVSWRLLYSVVIKRKMFAEKAIILGSDELARNIVHEIEGRKDLSYDIASIVTQNNKQGIQEQFNGIPVHQGFDKLCDLVDAENAKSVIVALDEKRGIFPDEELLKCKVSGINVIDGESFYERITGKLLIEKIKPSWLIFSDGFVKSKISRATNRLVGLLLSALMLLFLFPLMLLVAVAIKLNSRGPVLFVQERVGENGKVYTLYKFRSMVADAEKGSGPVWASEDDPRITRVGKLIRKLRVDELPQLWNVFKGNMSFVGPRPERPFFAEKLKKTIPYYNERFSVKPGVTGWAQIKYAYGASEEDALEKLKYDLYYIKNMSLVMDLTVIFHTAKIVLLGRGSR
ncbi:MAG: TIGR03013 family PEP-CTERM/XrtA system glycosyltransferase [Candidatus Aminicenantes bacterium]|nr:MAG: TIGR03013 family PEP-CTERM/XrtA system glycosyltransferase [Candidatus Aminicenantes bacterium]